MSSLFAGPSSITPWIEDTCFRALVHGPEPQRPRLVQVLAQRLHNQDCEDCPSFLVIHDGKTSAVAFLQSNISTSSSSTCSSASDKNKNGGGLPSKGCIVRISNWNVSLVNHCAGRHLAHILDKPDAASYYLELKPRLCLSVKGAVETLGAHGIGIVGNPVHVHQSVEVRRALMSLEEKKCSLAQRLKLVAPAAPHLGNVQELFREGKTDVIDTLLALAKNNVEDGKLAAVSTTTTTTNSGVVLGDVKALLESSRNKPPKDNLVLRIIAMANQSGDSSLTGKASSSKRDATSTSNEEGKSSLATTEERKEPTSSNNGGGVVLGNVEALLAGRLDLGIQGNPLDAIFAAARRNACSTAESKQDDDDKSSTDAFNNVAKKPQWQEPAAGAEEPAEESHNVVVEPYGIRERVDSRASVVSLSGIQSILKSVLPKSFISESAADDTDNAAKKPESQSSQEDENSESQVAGISDMLISQTQEGSEETAVEETVVEETVVKEIVVEETIVESTEASGSKKRPREEAFEQVDEEATDVYTHDKPATQPKDDFVQMDDEESDRSDESAATKEDRDENKVARRARKEPQGKRAKKSTTVMTRVPKKKKKGMLSLWKEQRARRKERAANKM